MTTTSETHPSATEDPELTSALAWCHDFVATRAPGDPLAMSLNAHDLRQPAEVVYAFARHTTDLAEGTDGLRRLAAWEDELLEAFHGAPRHPILVALLHLSRTCGLPITPLRDLVDSARASRLGTEPATFEALVAQARASAGPLAWILLYISGCREPAVFSLGERFAIGLRLADDLVDRLADAEAGRTRIAREDLLAFDVTLDELRAAEPEPPARELLAQMAVRARMYLRYGAPLLRRGPAALRPLLGALLRHGLRTTARFEADGDISTH